jgi:antitoxin component YwqK of YwqJK toxin-antitoxin module
LFSSCSPPPLKEKQEYLFYINSDDQSPSSFGFGICTERDLILKPYNQYDLYNKYIEENYLESEKWRFEMEYKYQSRVLLILNKLKTTNSGIIKQNFIGAIPNWEKNTVTYQTDLLNFEGQFSNGKMNGIWKIYYPISYVDLLNSDSYLHRLWKKGYYKKGKKEGIWITIDENGKEKKEKYQNGEKKVIEKLDSKQSLP